MKLMMDSADSDSEFMNNILLCKFKKNKKILFKYIIYLLFTGANKMPLNLMSAE